MLVRGLSCWFNLYFTYLFFYISIPEEKGIAGVSINYYMEKKKIIVSNS